MKIAEMEHQRNKLSPSGLLQLAPLHKNPGCQAVA